MTGSPQADDLANPDEDEWSSLNPRHPEGWQEYQNEPRPGDGVIARLTAAQADTCSRVLRSHLNSADDQPIGSLAGVQKFLLGLSVETIGLVDRGMVSTPAKHSWRKLLDGLPEAERQRAEAIPGAVTSLTGLQVRKSFSLVLAHDSGQPALAEAVGDVAVLLDVAARAAAVGLDDDNELDRAWWPVDHHAWPPRPLVPHLGAARASTVSTVSRPARPTSRRTTG